MAEKCIPMQKRERKRKRWGFFNRGSKVEPILSFDGSLATAEVNKEYFIEAIETKNEEMKNFLFTLGCYEGEAITLISRIADQYVIVIKDARYSIDKNLASCIKI